MKPILIYDIKVEDGEVRINKEIFERLLDEVYNAGVNDGQKNTFHPNNIRREALKNPFPYGPIVECRAVDAVGIHHDGGAE